MRGIVALALASIVAGTQAVLPAAETTILVRRVHPTKVSWGEIVFAEGDGVRVTLRDPVRLLRYALVPYTLVITSRERARNEDPSAPYLSIPVPKPDPRAAVYLAVDTQLGEKRWRAFVEDLHQRAMTYTPETFAEFVRNFPQVFESAVPPFDGPFAAPFCLKIQGEKDTQLEARTEPLEDGSLAITVTGTSGSRDNCAQLEAGLQRTAEVVAPLVHRFMVHEDVEESLTLAAESRLDARAAPELAGARLLPDAFDGRAVFTRWTWRATSSRLGVDPGTISDTADTLDAAFFFHAPDTRFDFRAFTLGVAREFDASDEPPGVALLERLLRERIPFMSGAYAIFCGSSDSGDASVCAGADCGRLENAREACTGLRRRLGVD